MSAFNLVHAAELDEFTAALKTRGWHAEDFRVEEEEYDTATAEVEAETGEVIITCARTHKVGVYHVGPRLLLGDRFRGRFAGRKVWQAGAYAGIN